MIEVADASIRDKIWPGGFMTSFEKKFNHSVEQPRWERYISPESNEMPLIRVIKSETEEGFNAVFALELSGVRRSEKEDAEKNGERKELNDYCRNLIMAGISADQSIDLIYSGGKDQDGRKYFDWKIIGSSRGEDYAFVMESAKMLWLNVNVALGRIGRIYEFTPVSEREGLSEEKMDEGWFAMLKPIGIAVGPDTKRPMGFLSSVESLEEKNTVIVAPRGATSLSKNLDIIPIGFSSCESEVKLILSFSKFELTELQLRSLASSLKWLGNGQAKTVSYHPNLEDANGDENAVKLIGTEIELWLKKPHGVRINCVAVSKHSVPTALLSAVGAEIFNGSPVSTRTGQISGGNIHFDSMGDNSVDSRVVDLQGCVNSGDGMPHLFPSPSTLLEHNVKRVFSDGLSSPSDDGVLLGRSGNASMASNTVFSRDDRSRHLYVLGATGTGKSTLLYNMICQDIEKGEGVFLIDPHGDIYRQVLQSIPEKRASDVVLIDPCDFDNAVGINFMELGGPYRQVQMNFITNELLKIFDRLYDLKVSGGPIFEQYIRNTLLLLMDNKYDGATLMDLPRVFEDKAFREFLKAGCKSPIVKDFWERQAEEASGDASLRNLAPYITSKLNQFVTNAILRPIIGQRKSTIDFRKIMDEGKIVLVNLSKGLLGELDCKLLGMLLIGKLFSAAMSRVSAPSENRRPMFLYIDEFQNFTTESVAQMLSEARKFGLYLTLANQNLSQLNDKSGGNSILDSVIGNVGSMLLFRLGPIDAEKMSAYTKPEIQAQDLQALPDFHAAARLLNKNTPGRPFVFNTLPMQAIGSNTSADGIIAMSRERYSHPT